MPRGDPDGVFAGGVYTPLDGEDEEDEALLLERVYGLFRAGRRDDAAALCASRGHLWRAAWLSGGSASTRLEEGGLGRLRPGAAHEALWRNAAASSAKALRAMDVQRSPGGKVARLEAALCGLAGLEAEPLLGEGAAAAERWEDRAWAHLSLLTATRECLSLARHRGRRRAASSLVRAARLSAPADALLEERTRRLRDVDLAAALDDARRGAAADASGAALAQDLMAGALLACEGGAGLAGPCEALVRGALRAGEARPWALRLAAHALLYLRALSEEVPRAALTEALENYAALLAERRDLRAVCCYLSLMPRAERLRAFVGAAAPVAGAKERAALADGAFEWFREDAPDALRMVVERLRADGPRAAWDGEKAPSGGGRSLAAAAADNGVAIGDLRLLAGLEWLSARRETFAEAVRQGCLLLRDLVAEEEGGVSPGRVRAARLLVERYVPAEAVAAFDGEPGDKPVHWPLTRREHGHWAALVKAHKAFEEWRRARAAAEEGAGARDEAALHLMDCANDCKDAITDVLCAEGGWLRGTPLRMPRGWSGEGAAGVTLPPPETRVRFELRQRVVPQMLKMLHECLHGTGAWCQGRGISAAAEWYRSALGVAETMAEEDHDLIEVCPKEFVKEMLDGFAASALELLRLG